MIGVRNPDERISYRGVTLSRRTAAAFAFAEKKAGLKGKVIITQGSWSNASASAGTHTGAGALDCSVPNLTEEQRKGLVLALKSSGFAAWYRKPIPGLWPAHIHALDISSYDHGMAAGAQAQVRSFDDHRDGLKGDAWDATFRPDPPVRFNYRLGRPVKR